MSKANFVQALKETKELSHMSPTSG